VSARTTQHTYTIKEAAAPAGLPSSTLRYYESIGVIAPMGRGESSKHRVYTDEDLDMLTWVACLSATGMSVSDMRRYMENGSFGAEAASDQVELLRTQQQKLELEAERIAIRKRYVTIKIEYWQAVAARDEGRVESLTREARALADGLKNHRD
jgi:DNA-binding transcriptional MerR regulator